MVLRGEDVVVIVPANRGTHGLRVLGLPKGHLDGEETPLEAALREVREETGVEAEPVEELGEIRYQFERGGVRFDKRVVFFLLAYRAGELQHDHEIEEVRWMPLAEAVEAVSYDGEREMLQRALSRARRDR